MQHRYPSRLVENAVEQLANLPGVGRKTALRLSLFLLSKEPSFTHRLTAALDSLRDGIVYCCRCHNISDTELCPICADPKRDCHTVCVVQTVSDVLAIENTAQYKGLYHVLGGVISPIDGIGPSQLTIDALIERVREEGVQEVVLALGSTMEGDTTNFFIYRRLSGLDVRVSVIARGIAVGDEIEYADELTLGRSILNRTSFDDTLKH
ncbi:recombination mediator RecR [Porphyromonas crevioricanis]|uniref:recombination mediator RecR n=1 Tax=Porphyromonas crevioricanis TaxID=393921 RepID=UPI0005A983AC|nr:recombination mediator RecR [Porphyromonas crevioricanis]SJZ94352.1 DNA replication and repair protein RecR [Porphyromonas crevioricanis]